MVMYVNCPGSAEEKVVDVNLHSAFTGITKVASLKCLGLVYLFIFIEHSEVAGEVRGGGPSPSETVGWLLSRKGELGSVFQLCQ